MATCETSLMILSLGKFAVMIISFAGMFFWSRSESRADSRRIENLINSIQLEIKDFHGRLCALEEKNKGK